MSIKSYTLSTKHSLIYKIEQNLNNNLYPEMCKSLKDIITKNTVTHLGFEDTRMGLMSKGVSYYPDIVKSLSHLDKPCLSLHKSTAAEFADFLKTYRGELVNFALFRNMLIKAVSIADNTYDIAVLTTIPFNVIDPSGTVQTTSYGITPEVLSTFKTNHKKSIELVEYYSTFSKLFGDIQNNTEE